MLQCPSVPGGAAAASGLGASRAGGWGLGAPGRGVTDGGGRVCVTVQTSDCGFLGHRPYFELGVQQRLASQGFWRTGRRF